MRFEHLRQRVERAEARVQRSMDHAEGSRTRLRQLWRESWTPTRIMVAGFVSGFLIGRAEPLSKVGSARWLQMLSTASTMFASIRAASASATAEDAAESAAEGAASAEVAAAAAPASAAAAAEAAVTGTGPQTPAFTHPGPAGPAPLRDRAPAPAEAATEISER
mgnify:CR=1 FL=1